MNRDEYVAKLKDFSQGCDAAWDSLQEAYGEARKHFEKKTRA